MKKERKTTEERLSELEQIWGDIAWGATAGGIVGMILLGFLVALLISRSWSGLS